MADSGAVNNHYSSILRPNPKPLPRRLLGGQFPVVAEDDGGGIAGFEGDLVSALHDGDAVGNERVAQDVPRPRDAQGLREGGDFAVLAAGRNDSAAAAQRSQPRCEIVADRDDAAGGRLRLTGPHFDDAAVEVHRGPVEPGDFGAPDPCEGADRKEGDEVLWSGVDDLGELVRCEDADVGIRHLHLPQLARGGRLACGQVVLLQREGEENVHGDEHGVPRHGGHLEAAEPRVDFGGSHIEDRAGTGGSKAPEDRAELDEVTTTRAVLFAGGDQLLDHLGHGGAADDRTEVLRVLCGHGCE